MKENPMTNSLQNIYLYFIRLGISRLSLGTLDLKTVIPPRVAARSCREGSLFITLCTLIYFLTALLPAPLHLARNDLQLLPLTIAQDS